MSGKEISDAKKTKTYYIKFNEYLCRDVSNSIKEIINKIRRIPVCYENMMALQQEPSSILFKYYYPNHINYHNQEPQDAKMAYGEIKSLWHHRAFKLSAGEQEGFSVAYESAHSFIYPGEKLHPASEPLYFRLISSEEFGAVLRNGEWGDPYVMGINGPL